MRIPPPIPLFNSVNVWNKMILKKIQLCKAFMIFVCLAIFSGITSYADDVIDQSKIRVTLKCDNIAYIDSVGHLYYHLYYPGTIESNDISLVIHSKEYDNVKFMSDKFIPSSKSKNVSIINGKQSTKTEIVWDVWFKPTALGSFKTPEYSIQIPDTLNISPIIKRIQVVDKSDHIGGNNSDGKCKNVNENNAHKSDIVVLKAEIDKDNIALGDSIIMDIKIISNRSLVYVYLNVPVEIEDCYYEQIPFEEFGESRNVEIDGIKCHEYTVLKYVIWPLRHGDFTIPELTINGEHVTSFFDPFGDNAPENKSFSVSSKIVKFKVKKK